MKKHLFFLIILILFAVNISNAANLFIPASQAEKDNYQLTAVAKLNNTNIWITPSEIRFDYFNEIKQIQNIIPDKSDIEAFKEYYKSKALQRDEISRKGHIVSMKFLNSNINAIPEFSKKAEEYYNYINSDGSKSRSKVALYNKMTMKNIYQGIDIDYYFDGSNMRYDYIIFPNSSPAQININFEGQDNININVKGEIELQTSLGSIVHGKIFAYQENTMLVNGETSIHKNVIPVKYIFNKEGNISFEIGAGYDKSKKLIIDPLVFATYHGGSSADIITDLCIHNENSYVTGFTTSSNFPVSTGAYDTQYAANNDAFVSKFSDDGQLLIYSTFINGSQNDYSMSIDVVDAYPYITGYTSSNDFPYTAGCFQDHRDNGSTCFLIKLKKDGSDLVYATFFGGDDEDQARDVKVDFMGFAYVSGSTMSSDFPSSSNAYQKNNLGDFDAYVIKFNTDATDIEYSTYIGGMGMELTQGLYVDNQGFAYITGMTESDDYRVTGGSYQTDIPGFVSAYISKIAIDGSSLVFSTYFGGDEIDDARSIFVDEGSKNVYIAGIDWSVTFPATAGAYKTITGGSEDGFIAIFDDSCKTLNYCTLMGGDNGDEVVEDIFIDDEMKIITVGQTNATDFDVTTNALQSSFGGGFDAFITIFDFDLTSIFYSTYFGGSIDDNANAIDYDCNIYVAGQTSSTDLPTEDPLQSSIGGATDGWLMKLKIAEDNVQLISPTNNQIRVNPIPEFIIPALGLNNTWNLEIATDANFTDIVYERYFITDSAFSISKLLDINTFYYARTGLNTNAYCYNWSDAVKFKTSKYQPKYKWVWDLPVPPKYDFTDITQFGNELIAIGNNSGFVKIDTLGNLMPKYTPIGYTWTDAKFFTADSGYIAGYNSSDISRVFKTTDGGEHWEAIFEQANFQLYGMSWANKTNVYLCGNSNLIYNSFNGGTSWSSVPQAIVTDIYDIFFIDVLNGWAVGNDEYFLKTIDGGVSWNSQTLGNSLNVNAVKFADSMNGWAVGEDKKIFQTIDGGTIWTEQQMATGVNFNNLYLVNSDELYVVGTDAIYYTDNAGSTWTDKYTIPNNYELTAVAKLGDTLYYVGNNRVVLFEDTSLHRYENVDYVNDIWCMEQIRDNFIAVGTDSAVIYSKNNGGRWFIAPYPTDYEQKIVDIEYLIPALGYYLSEKDTIYTTIDSGRTFKRYYLGHSLINSSLSVFNTKNIWVSSENRISYSIDGGESWAISSFVATQNITDIHFINNKTGFAVADKMYKSTNGGVSWSEIIPITSPIITYKQLHFVSPTIAYAAGLGGIIKTEDAGATWTVLLDLPTADIEEVLFINEMMGYYLDEDNMLYITTDGGSNWEFDQLANSDWFNGLSQYMDNKLWAYGENGSIAHTIIDGLRSPKMQTQILAFKKGWNMVSLYIEPDIDSLEELFEPIESDLVIMKNGKGRIYYPLYDINTIEDWEQEEGYLIYMQNIKNLEVVGLPIDGLTLHLTKGWNMISYPNNVAIDIETALQSIDGKFIIVKNIDGKIYYPLYLINTIVDLLPGQGYLIYMNEAADLLMP